MICGAAQGKKSKKPCPLLAIIGPAPQMIEVEFSAAQLVRHLKDVLQLLFSDLDDTVPHLNLQP